MSNMRNLADAIGAFAEMWHDDILMGDVGPSLTCSEVEALADMLRAAGYDEAATDWVAWHAEEDEPEDMHYKGES